MLSKLMVYLVNWRPRNKNEAWKVRLEVCLMTVVLLIKDEVCPHKFEILFHSFHVFTHFPLLHYIPYD